MKVVTLLVIAFLLFGGYLVVKYNNYRLDNPDDAISFTKDYGRWLFGVGKSVSNVVGAAVTEQWLPAQNDSLEDSNTTQTNQTFVVSHD